MKEIMQTLKPFFQGLAGVIEEEFGIDLLAWGDSPIFKAVIAAYFFCLIYLIVQLLRKKCGFDCGIVELGKLDLYFFWGLCGPLYFFQMLRRYPATSLGVKAIAFVLFFGLMLLLAHEPLGFFADTVKQYGFSGVLYSFALLGVGLVGILILLVQFVAAALPGLILMCLGVGLAVWGDDGHYRARDDEDDW